MSDIISLILRELPFPARRFNLIRSNQGIHVFRCEYEGHPVVVKFFEHEGDRREIGYYRLFQEIGVPTMTAYALTDSCIVLEDITASEAWRLGGECDMDDPAVLRALAKWYFILHEAGENHPSLGRIYSENDEMNESTLAVLQEYLPGAAPLLRFAEARLPDLRALLIKRENTLTYNDFYYTNLLVRRNGASAMMFDYNCLGRGYRYADFRNVESSVSEEAFAAFAEGYSAFYRAKYGADFAIDETDRRLDGFLSPLLGLVSAFKREAFPAWAEPFREDALSGVLLAKGKEIFEHA